MTTEHNPSKYTSICCLMSFILLLGLGACKKEDSTDPMYNSTDCRVKIQIDSVSKDTVKLYKYDSQGRLAEMVTYGTMANQRPSTIYTYSGNTINVNVYEQGTSRNLGIYYVDHQGRVMTAHYSVEGTSDSTFATYHYNAEGYLTAKTQVYVNANGSISDADTIYSFQYDADGNKIRSKGLGGNKGTIVDYIYTKHPDKAYMGAIETNEIPAPVLFGKENKHLVSSLRIDIGSGILFNIQYTYYFDDDGYATRTNVFTTKNNKFYERKTADYTYVCDK